jgi:hypothetical protein
MYVGVALPSHRLLPDAIHRLLGALGLRRIPSSSSNLKSPFFTIIRCYLHHVWDGNLSVPSSQKEQRSMAVTSIIYEIKSAR